MPKIKRNKHDREWSKQVRERDDNKCAVCNSKAYIQAHHIIPIENKEFRFNLDNGISLCPLHHKWGNEISPHKNPLKFFMWMEEHRPKQLEILKNGTR